MTIEKFDKIFTKATCWFIVLILVFSGGIYVGRQLHDTVTIIDHDENENVPPPPWLPPVGENWAGWVSYNVVVAYNNDSSAGLITAGVKIENGSGLLYFQAGPAFDYSWQWGAANTKKAVSGLGICLENKDIYVKVALPEDYYVAGDSGSGALLAAIVAAAENKTLDNSYVVSIAVQYDGSLGGVGAADTKQGAVIKEGMKLVVVLGQPIDNTEGVVFVGSSQELVALVVK